MRPCAVVVLDAPVAVRLGLGFVQLLKRRRTHPDFSFGRHCKRAAVENELVLAADHIDVDDRQSGVFNSASDDGLAIVLTRTRIGRAIDRYDAFGPGVTCRPERLFAPDVLADM